MAGLPIKKWSVMVTIASSLAMMVMQLQIVSGRSLPVDCSSQSVVLSHTWRHPCRGSTPLSITATYEDTEAAAEAASVESIIHQIRLLKQDSATAERKALRLKNRYISKRLDRLTATLLEEQFEKSPEFPDLRPLTQIVVRCSSSRPRSDDEEMVDHGQRKQSLRRKAKKEIHFMQTLDDVVSRSAEVLSFSSILLQRAITHEECHEPNPLSESFTPIQHDVNTMLCRLNQVIHPRSISSMLSNDTIQALESVSHSYTVGESSMPRHWVDYLVLRDIVHSMRRLKQLYTNLIDYNNSC